MFPIALNRTTLGPATATLLDDPASKLMNSTSAGASLLEMSVWNGSVHPIYLTVTVTEPTSLNVSSDFVMRHTVTSTTTTNLLCSGAGEPAACDTLKVVDAAYNNYDSPGTSVALEANQFTLPALVYPVDSTTNALGTPIAVCTEPGCSTAANTYEFALPGRDPSILGNSPPKRYLVVVSTGQISQLRPVDAARPSTASMVDTSVAGVRISGALGPSADRCLTYVPGPIPEQDRCTRTGRIQAYRASTSLGVSTVGDTSMALQTSALPALAPGRTRPDLPSLQAAIPNLYSWSVLEGALPPTP